MANLFRPSEEKSTSQGWTSNISVPTTFQTPTTSPRHLDIYLIELRHEAHRQLDAGRAEALVTEVTTHLNEAVESRVYEGISQDRAEKEAIYGFDSPRKFVGRLAGSAYETRFSLRIREWGFAVAILCLALYSQSPLFALSAQRNQWSLALASGILAVVISSFFGRRIEWRRYALLCALVTGITLFVAGYRGVYVPVGTPKMAVFVERGDIPQKKNAIRLALAVAKIHLEILKDRVTEHPHPLTTNVSMSAPPANLSPIELVHWNQIQLVRSQLRIQAQMAREWANKDKLLREQRLVKKLRLKLEAYEILASTPYLFNKHASLRALQQQQTILLPVVLLLLHYSFASLGSHLYRMFQQWVWRLRMTTR